MELESRVRVAVHADFQVLLQLYRAIDREHQEYEPALKGRRGDGERVRWLHHALSDPDSLVAVALENGKVVGFLMAAFIVRRPDVILEAVCVDTEHRRRGHGRALMERLEQWVLARGGRYIELDVYEFKADARSFYENLGYLPMSCRMRKKPGFEDDIQGAIARGQGHDPS